MTVNRIVFVVLVALLAWVHGQLWLGLGRGGQPAVSALERKLAEQNQANEAQRHFNERLSSEVADLKEGLETVEEKARAEMGMVKPNEIYVRVMPSDTPGGGIVPMPTAEAPRPRGR